MSGKAPAAAAQPTAKSAAAVKAATKVRLLKLRAILELDKTFVSY